MRMIRGMERLPYTQRLKRLVYLRKSRDEEEVT